MLRFCWKAMHAAVAALLAVAPAQAQLTTSGLLSLIDAVPQPPGCTWIDDTRNFAFPETNAKYYRASAPTLRPAGSYVLIEGSFVAVRYLSLQLYDGTLGGIDGLPDYKINALPGSTSTIASITALNKSVVPGGLYRVKVVFEDKPAVPAPNTLYAGTAQRKVFITLRHYLEPASTPLPKLSFFDGSKMLALGNASNSTACAADQNLQTPLQTLIFNLATDDRQALYTGPANNRVVPFSVYYGLGLLGQGTGVNQDGRYMSASVNKTTDVVIVRGRAPTFAESSVAVPQLRYWSICQNRQARQSVVDCTPDRKAPIDGSGYFHVAIAGDEGLTGLTAADLAQAGFARLPFGSDSPASIIYRQILINPTFEGSINLVPQGSDPAAIIGDYAPVAAYCRPDVFASAIKAGKAAGDIYRICVDTP